MPRESQVKLQKRPRDTDEREDTEGNEIAKDPTRGAEKMKVFTPLELVTANRVASLLAKWPGNATRAFWEAMKEGDSTKVAMAIVKDPSYGLEKAALECDLKDIDELKSCKFMAPLNLAIKAKRPDMVRALLRAGANPNAKKHCILSEAWRDLESFKALVAAGAEMDQSMIWVAAREGNADIIRLLAAKGLSVKNHSRDRDDESPIHIAAKEGHTAAVEAILDFGENVDVLTHRRLESDSALTIAAAKDHIETVKLLVARGAKINLRPRGHNALDKALQDDNIAMVKTLLALGADVKDDISFAWASPAYSWNHVRSVEVAKLLVSYGVVIKLECLNSESLRKPVLEYYFQQILLDCE